MDSTTFASCPGERFPLAVVILARDEADVIERSLAALRPQLQVGDSMHVVADHCRDETAQIAEKAGATVHRRSRGTPGKGQALIWWLAQLEMLELRPAGVVIVDADSLIATNFIPILRGSLMAGHRVVQARVAPLLETEDPISVLAALSEDIEQRVFDRVRRAVGAPVRLRGTGMAFHTETLRHAASGLKTSVEDAELSLLLFVMGLKAKPVARAVIYDPKPCDTMAASRQRARWLKGHWQVIAAHRMLLQEVASRGPAGWALLGSLFLKPRILFLPALMGLAAFGLMLAAKFSLVWFSLLLAPIIFNLVGLVVGIALAPSDLRKAAWRALPRVHRFLMMWIRSLRLARSSRDPWLRARIRVDKRQVGEATTAGQ